MAKRQRRVAERGASSAAQDPREQASTADDRSATPERRPRQEEIAARAYEIFQARGGEHGRDLDDWLQAENELRQRQGGESR